MAAGLEQVERVEEAAPRLPPRWVLLVGGQEVDLSSLFEWVVWVALSSVLVAAVFLNDWGKITPDWVPHLYLAPGRTLLRSLFSWRSEPFLGQPNIHVGLAPTAALILLIRSLGFSTWVTIRIWHVLLLLLAGWGAVRLFRRVTHDRSTLLGRTAVALVYVANPYVVVSGALLPTLLPYALLPWLLLAFHNGLENPKTWRWPAAFALVFFLMGGVNAGVVPLFLLLAIPGYLVYMGMAEGIAVRRGLAVAARCLGLAALVSIYWIVPSILAEGTGSSIAFTSEQPRAVASTSSYAESLRLLGFWLQYGFRPNQLSYFSNPFVVLASFGLPLMAVLSSLFSRSRVRTLGALFLIIGVPTMVGSFPSWSPTPFGRALNFGFFHIPGAIAFRTTNKAGAIVALALALLIALGARSLAIRRSRNRIPLAALGAIMVAFSVYPAWTGSLYPSAWKLPDYWRQAAAQLNAGSSSSRVLFEPGDFLPVYRWGLREVEDLNESLLSRHSVVRPVLLYSSAYGANYLAALDVPMNTGAAPKGLLPTMARYLGASDVLMRNDMVWEESGMARPSALAQEIAGSGLQPVASYGSPGENVVPTLISDRKTSPLAADLKLPPLQLFSVPNARPIVRAESTHGSVLIDGDSFALAPLQTLGVLDGNPSFQLLGSLTAADLQQALGEGGRIVLSDSNRRAKWNFQRTDDDHGPLLTAEGSAETDALESYALYWNEPDKQTVAVLRGARSIEASQVGSVFRDVPSSDPAFAFDGDPHTAWVAGDAGTAIGQWVQIDFQEPRTISRLTFRPVIGSPVEIRSVRLVLGDRSFDVELPEKAEVTIKLPPTRASSMRIEITDTLGIGDNAVGFWDVAIPGITVTKVSRLPRTLSNLYKALDPSARTLLATASLDVVLTRQLGDPSTAFDDEERQIVRQFELPQPRDFTFLAQARAGPELPESVIDSFVGADPNVVATSSSRLTGSPFVRASQTLDGNPYTAWLPGTRDAWIDIRFPPRTLDHIDVSQGAPNKLTTDFALSGELSIDGGTPIAAQLGPGQTRIDFPPRIAHQIHLAISKVSGVGGEIRINEIEIPGIHMPTSTASTRLSGCVDLFDVDGRAVMAHAVGSPALQQIAANETLTFEPCDGRSLSLRSGPHLLQATRGWLIDLLNLSSGSPTSALPDTLPVDGRFAVPVASGFTLSGRVRAGAEIEEPVVDHLVGVPDDVQAVSSSRPFDLLQFRASRVLDHRPRSAWIPEFGGIGEFLDLRFPPLRLNHLSVAQKAGGLKPAKFASEADITLGERPPIHVALHPGSTRIDFAARVVDHVRITITKVEGSNGDVRISGVGIAGLRVPQTRGSTPLTRCTALFAIDGLTFKARLSGTLGDLTHGRAVKFSPCEGQQLSLTPGLHTISLLPGWRVDAARFSWQHQASRPEPTTVITRSTPASLTVRAAPSTSPYFLVLGQAFDERWTAAMDGKPLGKPLLIDGYSIGWRVDQPGAHTFQIEFSPQRWAMAAQLVSMAALVVALVFFFRRRSRSTASSPNGPPVGQ